MINRKNKKVAFRLIKWSSAAVLASFLSGGIFMFAAFAYFANDLPDFKEFSEKPLAQSTKIYDRTGSVVLYDVYGEEKRTVIPFEKIPQTIKDATIAIEDDNFYSHNGINVKSIIRAFIANAFQKKVVQGGSTITQQLIKNYFLSPEKTFSRKIKEVILSLELEQKYSKEEILEFYLNQIPYGANAYGIESAASTFFNKPASELSLAQSALLAALPKAPSYYSPYGRHTEELFNRKNYILERMHSLGFIDKNDLEKAKSEALIFAPQKKSIKAPHFVMYVKNYLEEKYGDDYILKNGLRVYTTLDWDTQQMAEKVVYDGAVRNAQKYNAKNAALAAIDAKTGQILAMVGSYDYFDAQNDGNVNVTIMNRQPGSSFKPFGYAAALEKGFTPETALFDLPTEFSPAYPDLCPPSNINFSDDNNLCYHPQNYDGKFRGPVDLRHSLAQSLNIPSVKVLYLAGIKETVDLAKKLGITTLNGSDYGLSLILGSADVKPLDMAAAYSVFANGGVKNEKTAILKIEDYKGNILEEYKLKPQQVLNSQVARQINSILSDNSARAPVFGEKNYLYLENYPTAAKTGTTQDNKDAWVVGYSPDISVAIWVGNNNNDKISQSGAGISAAGPIWNEFMKQILQKNTLKSSFIAPDTAITNKDVLNGNFEAENKIKIDKISKKLATENTPPEFIEEASQKVVHSILYFIDKNNVLGEKPQNPENDPQFLNWELPVLEWVKEQNKSGKNYNQLFFNREVDNIHTEENKPKITVISPQDNEVINSYYLSINTNISSIFPIKQVDYFMDGQLLGSSFNYPYNLNFPVFKINQSEDKNRLLNVIIYDIYGNKNEKQISVIINN